MTDDRMAALAVSRHINRTDGSKVIPVKDGLFDVFHGTGFRAHSRIRIIKFRAGKKGEETKQLILVNGNLSQDQRQALLSEIH